jgi:hypothetical protein
MNNTDFKTWLKLCEQQTPNRYVPNMRSEIYHAGPGLNASTLGEAHAIYMRHEWCRDHKPTVSKTLGTCLHKALLEPNTFDMESGFEEFFTFAPGKSLDSKEAVRHQECHPDKVMVLAGMPDAARSMRDAILAQPDCHDTMCWQAETEISGFAWDEQHAVMCKIRMDWKPRTGNVLVDVKTCESVGELDYWQTCRKWGYHMKAAFVHIAVTSSEPYIARRIVLAPDFIADGRVMYQERMARLLHAHRTNNYDPYFDESGYLVLTAQRPFSGGIPQV